MRFWLVRRANHAPQAPLGVVHRIDKETSGLVIFARTFAAKKALSQAFRGHALQRRYVAIVHGVLSSKATLRSYFVEDRGDGLRGAARDPRVGERTSPSIDSDLSGSLVTATQPIQVIAGSPCMQVPVGKNSCDNFEESVLPAETFLVAPPTAPKGDVVSHVVRIYGNVDGTKLSYEPAAPPGAPTAIDAGEVVDLGLVSAPFRVQATEAIAITSSMPGAQVLDPSTPADSKGDPSLSVCVPLEQYRMRHVFALPDDPYDVSYLDVLHPAGASLTLDSVAITETATAVSPGHQVTRIKLSVGKGAHVLKGSKPVGIQVIGYARYASYQHPGGMLLRTISAIPTK